MDQLIPKDVTAALKLIEQEVMRARAKQHPIHSPHDGYAYLVAGLDDFWVSARAHPRVWAHLRMDAVRIAATAVRFILDITNVSDEEIGKALEREARLEEQKGQP